MITIATATVIIRGITTVVTLARSSQLLWNAAIAANPIGALLVVLGLAAAAVITFSKELTDEERAVRKTTNELVKLEQEQIQLTEKIKQGGIEVNAYKKKLQEVNSKLVLAKSGMSDSAGEANRFTTALKNAKTAADAMNNASLKKYRGQLGDTRVGAERLVEAQRELAYYMNGGKPGGYKPRGTGGTGGTANTFDNFEIYIPNYAGSTNKSFSVDGVAEDNSSSNNELDLVAGLWSSTSAINAVGLTINGQTIAQYSTAYLYGIKNS